MNFIKTFIERHKIDNHKIIKYVRNIVKLMVNVLSIGRLK